MAFLKEDNDFDCTVIGTVSANGSDGFLYAYYKP
jgi:hypothetical protein